MPDHVKAVLQLLGAIALPAVFAGAMLAHYAWLNYRARRCDACRIEREQRVARGTVHGAQSHVILTHACSPRRWPYKKPESPMSTG